MSSEAGKRKDVPRAPTTDDRPWEIPEAAYVLGVSCSTVRNLERDGELPALPRIRGRVRFDPAVVRRLRATGHARDATSTATAQVLPIDQARTQRGG
jgi:hypothetical protein